MINKETKDIIINSLERMKKEINKRDELFKHGVDLSNYENEYSSISLDLIIFLMGKTEKNISYKEEVEWWLYENVDKIYYITENNEKLKCDVDSALDFINFLIEDKLNIKG